MRISNPLRRLISALLAAALFFCPVLPARAAETLPVETESASAFPETTQPTLPPEETGTIPETTQETQQQEPEILETVPSTQPTETEASAEPAETTESTQPSQDTEPTETTEPPQTTSSTEPTEETIPEETEETTSPTQPELKFLTIAQALEAEAGTRNLVIQGTVVYVSGNRAVLQDETGGIRVSFPGDPGTVPGEVLRVTGFRTQTFYAEDFESLGVTELPAVETTLVNAPENLRLLIRNVVLGYDSLKQNDLTLPLTAVIPQDAQQSQQVDIWGVILDGRFYADTVAPSQEQEEEAEENRDWKVYFGLLHAHSSLSDDTVSPENAFAHAKAMGMDFFALTDHSDSLDSSDFGALMEQGSAISEKWARGKTAAAAVTDKTFAGIFGFEISWPRTVRQGHISTFNTLGWQSWNQPISAARQQYYCLLREVPAAVSQFNHPGDYFGTYDNFTGRTPEDDAVMQLLEIGTGEDPYGYYQMALDEGWHVAPTLSQNDRGVLWSTGGNLRTAIVARELTPSALYEAMANRRIYATEDPDLSVFYYLNDTIMGGIMGLEENLVARVVLSDPTDTAIGTVTVITDGGKAASEPVTIDGTYRELEIPVTPGGSCYYLKITQGDGQRAVTAPVWVDTYQDLGIKSFTAQPEKPVEGREVTLHLQLYNHEQISFHVEKITVTAGEEIIHVAENPGEVRALKTLGYPVLYTPEAAGEVTVKVTVEGTIDGRKRTFTESIPLYYQPKEIEVTTIAEARAGKRNVAYRVEGFITAGNDNPYNAFDDTLYLQDDSGGIAVKGCPRDDIELGTPMTVTGLLRDEGGNLFLELTDFELPPERYHMYDPRVMSNQVAMDYAVHGGELLRIEGTVLSLVRSGDQGLSRITIQDVRGHSATIVIEDEIGSSSYGENDLWTRVKKGRTIEAKGLLHIDEEGQTVLRVRDCDEVKYIAPIADPSNPKTGDIWHFWRK